MSVLDPYTRGDGFTSQRFVSVFRDDNGDITSPPGTAISALLQFREKNAHGGLIASFSTVNETLTVVDDGTGGEWIFETVEMILTNSYPSIATNSASRFLQTIAVWDLEVTHNGEDSPTTVARGTMVINADVSRAS